MNETKYRTVGTLGLTEASVQQAALIVRWLIPSQSGVIIGHIRNLKCLNCVSIIESRIDLKFPFD